MSAVVQRSLKCTIIVGEGLLLRPLLLRGEEGREGAKMIYAPRCQKPLHRYWS